jgi:hypothetical protein
LAAFWRRRWIFLSDARSSKGNPDPTSDASTGSASEPLGWWSLTPSVSIAVFLIVAMFTIDSSGGSRIGLALIAGVLVGPLASYLFDAYWPRVSTENGPVPKPGAKP